MKVLIYGHQGWIGQQFVNILIKEAALVSEAKEILSYVLATSRADQALEVGRELDLVQPTHVISFIGRTHGQIDGKEYPTIDYLEQPGKIRISAPAVFSIMKMMRRRRLLCRRRRRLRRRRRRLRRWRDSMKPRNPTFSARAIHA